MNNITYHPLSPKACRLDVQTTAKRSLSGIPSLAVANHRAPTIKIKGKSWICDDLLLVLRLTARSVVIHLYKVND